MDAILTQHHQKTYHVPSKFRRLVCMCEDPSGPPLFDYTRKPAAVNCCGACRKPYRWNLRRCTVCKEWFIKDFRTPLSGCARHTKCFACLESTEQCCPQAEHKTVVYFGPLGLNPREVSQEERDAAFDLPSVF